MTAISDPCHQITALFLPENDWLVPELVTQFWINAKSEYEAVKGPESVPTAQTKLANNAF